jgi:hypothetical protein
MKEMHGFRGRGVVVMTLYYNASALLIGLPTMV